MLVQRALLSPDIGASASPLLRPADAYRSDMKRCARMEQFGMFDGSWIALADLLTRVEGEPKADAPRWEAIDQLLIALAPSARLHLDPSEADTRDGIGGTPEGERSRRIRLVAEHMEDACALELADVTLAAYSADSAGAGVLELGRLSSQRARICWKLGDTLAAHSRYREAERLGQREGYDELLVRAWIGYAILGRLRGNYPDCRRWTDRAIRLGNRRNYNALTGLAHHVAMVSAAVAHDYGTAVLHGWGAFVAASGDPVIEGDVLVNLAQVMLDAGHPDTARAGFAATLARSAMPRHLLPVFGGYALACARLGDTAEVHRAVESVAALKQSGLPYETASALLECAAALAIVEAQSAEISELRARAVAIAKAHGFHELAVTADLQDPRPCAETMQTFSAREHEVCLAIEALAPTDPRAETGRALAAR